MNGVNAVPISTAEGFVVKLNRIFIDLEPHETLQNKIFEDVDIKNADSIFVKCPNTT